MKNKYAFFAFFLLAMVFNNSIMASCSSLNNNGFNAIEYFKIINKRLLLPFVEIGGGGDICPGESVDITFTGTPNAIVTYFDGTSNQTIVLEADGNAVLEISMDATYSLVSVYDGVETTNATGIVTVTLLDSPFANFNGDASICEGVAINLNFNGTSNATVTYTDGITSYDIMLDGAGNAVTSVSPSVTTIYNLLSVTNGTCTTLVNETALVSVEPSLELPIMYCTSTPSEITFDWTHPTATEFQFYTSLNSTIQTTSINNYTISGLNEEECVEIFVTAIGDMCNSEEVNFTCCSTVACSGDETIFLTQTADIFCSGECTAAINVDFSNFDLPIAFVWSPDLGDTNNPTGLCAGTYMLTALGASGCELSNLITISEPDPIVLACSQESATTQESDDGVANINISGGMGPYIIDYEMGNIAATEGDNVITNLSAGAYSASITDTNGCLEICTFIINESDCSGSDNCDDNDCNTADSYDWLNCNCVHTPISPLDCDDSNCETIDTYDPVTCSCSNVPDPQYPLDCDDNNCETIDTYDSATCSCSNIPDPQLPLICDDNNCSTTDSYNTDICECVNTPIPPPDCIDDGDCTNGIEAWNAVCECIVTPSVIGCTNPSAYDYDPLATCDTGLCCAINEVLVSNMACDDNDTPEDQTDDTYTFYLTVNSENTSATFIANDPNTTGGNFNAATAFGPYFISDGVLDFVISDIGDALCSINVSIVPPAACMIDCDLEVTVLEVQEVSCHSLCDGFIDITVTGGNLPFSYAWSHGESLEDPSNLCAGTYTVTVTDANICTTVMNVVISEPTEIDVTANVTNANCNGSGGSIELIATGGVPFYTYLWSNGSEGSTIDNLDPGMYSFTVTDANGCIFIDQVIVEGEASLEIIAQDIVCPSEGNNDGEISIVVSGGSPPYAYIWNNGENTPAVIGLIYLVYTITVTDAVGCTASLDVDLSNEVFPVMEDIVACSDDSVVLSAGFGGTSYLWTGPNGFTSTDQNPVIPNVTEAEAGLYTVEVEGLSYCTQYGEVTLSVSTFPPDDWTNNGAPIICFGESGQINAGEEIPDAIYEWTPSIGLSCSDCLNPIASPAVSTTYILVVTHASTGCTFNYTYYVAVDEDCVWPGDTDTSGLVNHFDLLNIGLANDSVGPVRPNATLLWSPQAMYEWDNTTAEGVNYKHIDADGNGMINAEDTLAIIANWGQMHNFIGGTDSDNQFTNGPGSASDANILMSPFYVQPEELEEGQLASFPIILGEESSPMDPIYGIAFTIEYDTAIVETGSSYILLNNSWMGTINEDMISIQQDFTSAGKIDIAITRMDGINMAGFGELGTLFVIIEDDIMFWGPGSDHKSGNADVDFAINITNVKIINFQEEEIMVVPVETISTVIGGPVAVNEAALNEAINIFPNPVHDYLNIVVNGIEMQGIEIFTITGQVVNNIKTAKNITKLKTSDLQNGTYLIRVQTNAGVLVKRIIITN